MKSGGRKAEEPAVEIDVCRNVVGAMQWTVPLAGLVVFEWSLRPREHLEISQVVISLVMFRVGQGYNVLGLKTSSKFLFLFWDIHSSSIMPTLRNQFPF